LSLKKKSENCNVWIFQYINYFFEIGEKMVSEIRDITDRHQKNCKEMVAKTMFSNIQKIGV